MHFSNPSPPVKIFKILTASGQKTLNSNDEIKSYLSQFRQFGLIKIILSQDVQCYLNTNCGIKALNHFSNSLSEIQNTNKLVGEFYISKENYNPNNHKVGKVLEGITLKETFLPITKLSYEWGIESHTNNLNQEPLIITRTNRIAYAPFLENGKVNYLPIFRKVELLEGPYTQSNFLQDNHIVGLFNYFDERAENGGKITVEFQHWLNELHSKYVPEAFTKMSMGELVYSYIEDDLFEYNLLNEGKIISTTNFELRNIPIVDESTLIPNLIVTVEKTRYINKAGTPFRKAKIPAMNKWRFEKAKELINKGYEKEANFLQFEYIVEDDFPIGTFKCNVFFGNRKDINGNHEFIPVNITIS